MTKVHIYLCEACSTLATVEVIDGEVVAKPCACANTNTKDNQ